MTSIRQEWEKWAVDSHFDLPGKVLPSDVVVRLRKTLSHVIALDRGATILDVGCGDGHLIGLLEHLRFERVVGTEYSFNRLSYGQDKHITQSPIVNCDALRLAFQSGLFDVVISVGVIEHVVDQEQFVAELSRITRKGGIGIITTDCFAYRIEKWLRIYKPRFPIDRSPFPPTLFRQLKRHGFKVKGFEAWGLPYHHLQIVLNRCLDYLELLSRRIVGDGNVSLPRLGLRYACGSQALTQVAETAVGRSATPSFLNLLSLFYKGESLFIVEKI